MTSHDSDTDRRDRREKPAAYAAAGIPVHETPFGKEVVLPDPVGITLDTEVLKNYVR